MNTKKIKEFNGDLFLKDIKSVREILVFAKSSYSFFRVLKRDVLEEAEKRKIHYYITDSIFVIKRNVIVII